MNNSSSSWFGKLFKKVSQQGPGVVPEPASELAPPLHK